MGNSPASPVKSEGKKFSVWLLYLLFVFLPHQEEIPSSKKPSSIQGQDSVFTLRLSFVGDLMCHSQQFEAAKVSEDSFDFSPDYTFIKEFLSSADITFGNLETVTAGRQRKYSGYPLFNTPDEYVTALKEAGFDFIFTSNNHSLDRGELGIIKTIENLNRNSLSYTGTFLNQRDRDSLRILTVNGFKLAVFSYTYGTNGNYIPKGKPYLFNPIDTVLIKNDITTARKNDADIILVYFHFGDEYKRSPSKDQVDIVNKTVSYGADLIIGSHPHVLQPVNFYKGYNARLDSVLVAYSLGNFISGQRDRYKDTGAILNIELRKSKQTDSVYFGELSFLPTWVYKGFTGNKNEFIIMPSEQAAYDNSIAFITPQQRIKAEQGFADSKDIITKYTSRIKLKSFRSTDY